MSSSIASQYNNTPSHPQDDDEIDLLALWNTIWRRKWAIAGLTAMVVILTVLLVLNMTPVYQSEATLLIDQRTAKPLSIEEIYGLDTSSREYLETQFALLRSRQLAERVVDTLNLTTHPEFDPRQQERSAFSIAALKQQLTFLLSPEDLDDAPPTEQEISDGVVKAFIERVTVSPVAKTQLVAIRVEMKDAELAARAANALANAYIQSQLEAKLNVTSTATGWMNDQISALREQLQDSEQALQAFRERENLVDVNGEVTSVTAGELSDTGDRLVDARRQRAEAESQYRQIEAMQGGDWRKLVSVPVVLSNPLVQEFRTQEAKARSRVQELSLRYGPKHPNMIAAREELDAAVSSLRMQVEQVVASVESAYQLALANERSLQNSFNQNRQEIQDITRKEFTLRELQREVDTNRQLYDAFLTRLKETSATQDFEAVNARVIDKAVTPTRPAKPKKTLIVAIAGLLAMFTGVGLTLLLEALNNTFRSSEDVENNLNLPVLGILPLIKGKIQMDLLRAFSKEEDRGFSEAIRTIRTSVVLSNMDKARKVTVVTSSVPGEGKSTLAANLAISLGQMEKVLLVDADMRRPSLARGFQLPVGSPGLANVIAGTANASDCFAALESGVDLLPAGAVPPNPQELLASARFNECLQEWAQIYDRIIIDSPPTMAVSDALLLSAQADAVVYVVKSDSTHIPTAQSGVGQLLQKNAALLGVVLNQVDVQKAARYGYRYSGYYDYYGYDKAATN